MRNRPLVTAVVLNYRHVDDTFRCLASLRAQEFSDLHIVVVDNTDGGADEDVALRRRLAARIEPPTVLIQVGENLGYAAGNNLGIRHGLERGSEFIWLVNPDATAQPDALGELVRAARDHGNAGILGSRIIYGGTAPAKVWFDGGEIDFDRGGATRHTNDGRLLKNVDRHTAVKDADYITGASFFVRAEVVRTLGGIPEDYFLYYEETDYCVQAQRRGWRTVVVPASRLTHFKRSTGELPAPYYVYYLIRNRLLFADRFTDATPDAVLADLQGFITAWRGRVDQNAPDWREVYDQLVEWAVEDGRAGRTGRRLDIDRVPLAAGKAS